MEMIRGFHFFAMPWLVLHARKLVAAFYIFMITVFEGGEFT